MTVSTISNCRPISSRLMTLRLRANPFNDTIVHVYAPTSSYDDNEVVLYQTPKQDSLVVQGNWKAKVGCL